MREEENSKFQLSNLLGVPSYHVLTITAIISDSHSGIQKEQTVVPGLFHTVLSRLTRMLHFCHPASSRGVIIAENLK